MISTATQVKGENRIHLSTAYYRRYVQLNSFNAIITCHGSARARRDIESHGQLMLNLIYLKLQLTHTRGLRMRAHRYKNVGLNKDLP